MKKHLLTRNTYIYYSIQPAIFGAFLALNITWLCFSIKNIDLINIAFSGALSVLSFILFLSSLCKIFAVIYFNHSYENYKKDICNDRDYVQVFEGMQGAGKSDTIKINTVIRAEYMWEQICSEYKLMSHQFLEKSKNHDWYTHFLEVKATYEFYNQNPKLFPCVISNIPLKIYGLQTVKFKPTMLTQEEKVLYGSTIVLDELKNAGLGNKFSGKLPREVDEFLRYGRHFGEIKIFGSDQNKLMVVLEMRNVAVNYTMISMKNYLSPKFLNFILERMIRRFNDKYKPVNFFEKLNAPVLSPIVNHDGVNLDFYFGSHTKKAMRIAKFTSLVNSIGFVQYIRAFRGSTQGNSANDSSESVSDSYIIGRKKIWKYYCPIIRPYESDSRLFKDIYKAKDKVVNYDSWGDDIYITREDWDELSELISSIVKKS